MKILALECRSYAYTCVRSIVEKEELDPELREGRLEDCIVFFISVEPGDDSLVAKGVKAMRRVARNSGAQCAAINAFAHLSSNLADLDTSKAVIVAVAERLRDSIGEVHVTPFGWHKEMNLDIRAGQWSQRYLSL